MSRESQAHSTKLKKKAETKSTELSNELFSGINEQALLCDVGDSNRCGVDLPEVPVVDNRLGGLERVQDIGLPGLSEPQAVRHYVRLSHQNYSIDTGIYPLGSCTMKHNPRLNEKLARLPGFSNIHPLQPLSSIQGALELMHSLATWLKRLTGMPSVVLSPAAGAHGELCGLMTIRAALDARGDTRRRVLVPDSAHGTNPASAVMCGFQVEPIPSDSSGRINYPVFLEKINTDTAALMLTNPNTCGLFESQIIELSKSVHDVGGFVYCDGANFNAIVGKVKPGDLGIDAMHLNLHKTFSTPHGGGGPGSGPVVLSEALAPYAPFPYVELRGSELHLVENGAGTDNKESVGRFRAYHGQMGMFVRALAYMMSHGADGLQQVAEDAVLNANYVCARLKEYMSVAYEGPFMHEVLFDDSFLEGSGVTTLDFAKALIDQGIHPMTIYFPLVVEGAMLTEPTESESKESLDRFCDILIFLASKAKEGDTEFFTQAPRLAPRARLDETRAARDPRLTWGQLQKNGGA